MVDIKKSLTQLREKEVLFLTPVMVERGDLLK
jgi:hypothetical protein